MAGAVDAGDPGRARCDPGRNSRALSVRQAALALAGLVVLVAGVLVAPGVLPLGPALITVGGLVLLLGVAWPLVNQVELGTPMLLKVTIAAQGRHDRLQRSIEDLRGLLVACAADLCPDGESAVRAVETSVSRTLASWHGTQGEALQRYLLCVLVQQARYESNAHPRAGQVSEPVLALPLRQREVLVLMDRVGLDLPTAAAMLAEPEPEVAAIHARALETLAHPGSPS